jgi:Na+/H+ antiporter NhaA
MAAIYGMSEHVLAVIIAPALVSVFTEMVFHDPAKIGWAMATTTCIAMPLAMIALALGLKPAARAADQAADLAAELAASSA